MTKGAQYGLIALIVLVAVLAPAVVGWYVSGQQNANDSQQLYENQVAACERGNPLRGVVFRNTQAAVAQSKASGDAPQITRTFQRNLNALLSTPGLDPRTGEVDCEAVIEKP